MTKVRVYRSAITKIENGWTKRAYHRDGNYCLVGAVRRAERDHGIIAYAANEKDERKTFILREEVWAEIKSPRRIEKWNDAPWRRKSDVLAVLRRLEAKACVAAFDELTERIIDLEAKLAAAIQERDTFVRLSRMQQINRDLKSEPPHAIESRLAGLRQQLEEIRCLTV